MLNKRSKTLLYIIGGILCATIAGSSTTFADNLGYDVRITPSLLVTIPSDTVSLNLDPFTSAFGTTNLPITVSTNNPTGFTLNMSASETDLTLVNGSETIPTLADKTGGYSEAEFTANRWGYKLSTATNYSPFALSNELLVTDSPSNASTSTVNFASKVDATKPAGTYELTINFTAVANYVPPADVPTTCNTPVPGNYTYLQDINSSNKAAVLASLTEGEAYFLRDSRDEEPYCISKLADGNLWFLDNLRLDLTDSTILNTLSSANTNINSATETATLTSLKSGNRSAGDQYATAGVSSWASSNSYSAPLIATSGNCDDTTACVNNPESGKWHKDANTFSYGSGSGKIGIYYNYCAASAGSYCYGDGADYGASSGNATEDICPKGWRMPTGGSSGEYQALVTAYNSNQIATDTGSFQYNFSIPFSGLFFNGSAYYQVAIGYFWSSTRAGNGYMYSLYVNMPGDVDSSSYYDSSDTGDSVRCLLK